MHYRKLNELSKLQGFSLVKHLTPGNCDFARLLQYQPCNLKVHMCTGTDRRSYFCLLKLPNGTPRSISIFPAICNGTETKKTLKKKIKFESQSFQNQENLVRKCRYIK